MGLIVGSDAWYLARDDQMVRAALDAYEQELRGVVIAPPPTFIDLDHKELQDVVTSL